MPVSSSNDLLLAACWDVISALRNPHSAQPLSPLANSRVSAIEKLHDIFRDHVTSANEELTMEEAPVKDPLQPMAPTSPAPPPSHVPPEQPPQASKPDDDSAPAVDEESSKPPLTQDLTFAAVMVDRGKTRRKRKRKSRKEREAAKLVASTKAAEVPPPVIAVTPAVAPTLPPAVLRVATPAALVPVVPPPTVHPAVSPMPVPRVATPSKATAPRVTPKPRPIVPTPPLTRPHSRPKRS